MGVDEALRALTRPIAVLGAGGTISMAGDRAVPVLDAEALVSSVPPLAQVPDLEAETVLSLPGPQLSLEDALRLAQRAATLARKGAGVVITTGTDTLEELAVLCSLTYDGEAPLVLTGANRPASAPGADGPANLLDAVAVAGSAQARGVGTCVCFAGELHSAMTVRKYDSTGPAAFASPAAGPLGRVVEGRLWLHALPIPSPTLAPTRLSHRVDIVTAALGDNGALLREAAVTADGIVLVALGAGHLPVPLLRELQAAELPVAITTRCERSSMLFGTYGFEGAESELRVAGAVCVPFLSAAAARMALLCCLGAGLGRDGIADTLAQYDAR